MRARMYASIRVTGRAGEVTARLPFAHLLTRPRDERTECLPSGQFPR